MSRESKSSLFTPSVIGLARAMEFLLVFPHRGDYENLKEGDASIRAALAHEWTHYFQFVSTNLGHLLVDLHHARWEMQSKLILFMYKHHGWDLSSPVLEWPHEDDSASDQSATLLRRALKDLDRIFGRQFSYFGSRGYEPSSRRGTPEVSLQRLEGSPVGRVRIGDWRGEISVLQILEHAAVTGEYLLGGFPFDRFFDSASADYFFGYWYLLQQGVITVRPSDGRTKVMISGCRFHSRASSIPLLMFLFTQIALNVSELVRVSGSTEEWRERADPHGFLLKAGAMATVAGAVFCELLENFEECALAAIERFDQTGSWVSAASAVCSARGLPDYKASIEVGIRRMERYLEEQRPVRRTGSDPLDFVLHTSKKVMLRGLENLLAHEAANARPLTSPGRIPFPKCLAFSKDGERHLLGIGFAWCPPPVEFVEVSKTALAWSLEEERVLEGLCNEREIPCYPPIEDDALAQVFAVWPCDDFERCRRVWAAGRRGFCTNEGWQERRERKSLLRRLVPR